MYQKQTCRLFCFCVTLLYSGLNGHITLFCFRAKTWAQYKGGGVKCRGLDLAQLKLGSLLLGKAQRQTGSLDSGLIQKSKLFLNIDEDVPDWSRKMRCVSYTAVALQNKRQIISTIGPLLHICPKIM